MRGKKPALPPLGEDDEPISPSLVRTPPVPEYLNGRSRDCWEPVTREMVARSIYDTDVRDMVAAYCVQLARFLDAEDQIHERGALIKSKKNVKDKSEGGMMNPYLAISNNAYDRMTKLSAELGLTPVSRKRVVRVRGATSIAPASRYLQNA